MYALAFDAKTNLRLNRLNKNKMEQEIDTNALGEAIVKTLKTIYDPEIPVDIYELGLIYDVMVNTDYEVKILMTLTSQTVL
jgi:metal-sulfur cluster biosynthetic enzyme